MLNMEILENVNDTDENVSWEVVNAYDFSKKYKNNIIIFYDNIMDVSIICAYMRNIGVEEFAIAGASTNLIKTLHAFNQQNCVMSPKTITVNGAGKRKIDAIKMLLL